MVALRPVDREIWVAEEPLRFVVEMGRRMTVVRVREGQLLIHSPATLTGELRAELGDLGAVRYVVPASTVHGHLGMEEWAAAYPQAELFAAPGLAKRRKDLSFAGQLGEDPDQRWSDVLDQTLVEGHRLVNEIVFFHRPSRSLIVGDTLFNISPDASLATRLWSWGPRLKQVAKPPPLYRAGIKDKRAARASIDRILDWDFDRVITGHGAIVESGGKEAFRDGWSWLRG